MFTMRSLQVLCLMMAFSQIHRTAAAEVTFTKDIASIMFENCSSCHRPANRDPSRC